jgi:hypothetical protein
MITLSFKRVGWFVFGLLVSWVDLLEELIP